MPKFDELLKSARSGRVQVLHEFLTNYDPLKARLHCFYEGREDEVFYRHFLERYTNAKLFPYICGNKDEVYQVLASISQHPGCEQSLFFVDKDLADVLGENSRVHRRLFVTSYYSIENYLVRGDVLERFCRDFVQCRGTTCQYDHISTQFDVQLERFHRLILPLMGWVVAVRRRGLKPNLRNLQLRVLFEISDDMDVNKALKRNRLAVLSSETGIAATPGIAPEVRRAIKELKAYLPKMVVRGKFESWFLVEYLKALLKTLRRLAEERGGSVAMNPSVEHSNFVALAVPTLVIPTELEGFLQSTATAERGPLPS